jgi:hypothetical protein
MMGMTGIKNILPSNKDFNVKVGPIDHKVQKMNDA